MSAIPTKMTAYDRSRIEKTSGSDSELNEVLINRIRLIASTPNDKVKYKKKSVMGHRPIFKKKQPGEDITHGDRPK